MAAAADTAVRLRRDGEALAAPFPALMAEAERVAATVMLGVHGRRRPGLGESFWEYRHHRAEDGAARVDWRRSARSDALFVRENEFEAAQTVGLWRDGRAGMANRPVKGRPTKKERASVLLIALAALLTRGGERVAVLGESETARSGRNGLARVGLRLAGGPGAPESFVAGEATPFAALAVASDFYEPLETWRERLGGFAARRATGALIQVVDPEEESFPFEGRTLFEAAETGGETLFGRAQGVRAAYRARFQAHRAGLTHLARSLGWAFITTRTDSPAAPALMRLHAAFAAQKH